MDDDQDPSRDAAANGGGSTGPPAPQDADDGHSDPSDSAGTPHERMERYEALADQEKTYRRQKRGVLDTVGDNLTRAVERALDETGANAVVESTGSTGTTQTLGVRLDRAALVARIADELPDGFSIDSLNDDGTVTVEWSRRTENSAQSRADTILKAIVAEEITTDADDLIESVPRRERVVDRAAEFDVSEEMATQRLTRLVTLDILDVEDNYVYPGGNFSRI